MNKLLLLTALIVNLGVLPAAFAQQKHDHKEHANHANHDEEGKTVTLTGHLIGMTCFIKHGSHGPSHKSCARECAEKGLPIGLKTDDGIYMVTGKGHDSLIDTYKPLLRHLENKVEVQGKAFERNGSKMILIERIRGT